MGTFRFSSSILGETQHVGASFLPLARRPFALSQAHPQPGIRFRMQAAQNRRSKFKNIVARPIPVIAQKHCGCAHPLCFFRFWDPPPLPTPLPPGRARKPPKAGPGGPQGRGRFLLGPKEVYIFKRGIVGPRNGRLRRPRWGTTSAAGPSWRLSRWRCPPSTL